MMGVQREERDTLCFIYFFSLVSLFFLCLFFWIYKIISLKVSKKKSEKEEEEEEERREELSKKEKRRDALFFFFSLWKQETVIY